MLSVKSISNATEAANYYEKLATEDYYESGGEPPGKWMGELRNEFYLNGTIHANELGRMLKGYHPLTGEELATNAGNEHKPGWDCTFSAPKSVSVLWALSEKNVQQAIQMAQANAVKEAVCFLEKHAFRNRDRGAHNERIHQILAAAYEHSTSREQDPQLHTHVIIANLAQRADGSICAIDFDTRWKMAAGAIYRAELAHQLKLAGFAIERDNTQTFQVSGVKSELCHLFSKRREMILEQADLHGVSSAKGMQVSAFVTRSAKGDAIPRAQLIKGWREEAERFGFNQEDFHKIRFSIRNESLEVEPNEVFKSLTQQNAVFSRMKIYQTVAVESQGILNAQQVQERVNQLMHDNELVKIALPTKMDRGFQDHEIHYTTQTQLALEQNIIEQAKRRTHETHQRALIDEQQIEHSTLIHEQIQALRHICIEAGAVKIIEGMAGTGKGYMLKYAHSVWQNAGYEVIGASIAGKAADGLQTDTGIPSQTLHSLIEQLDKGHKKLSASSIVVVDEAGMVGTRHLHEILKHVHQAGAKAILVGDSRQLQSIEAGGAFKLLGGQLGKAELHDIRRQHKQVDKDIVKQFADGETHTALNTMQENKQLHSAITHMDAMKQMVDDWFQTSHSDNDTHIMLAGTRTDIYYLNQLARNKLKESGLLTHPVQLKIQSGEIQSDREFSVGDKIVFTKNNYQLKVRNGETGIIKNIRLHASGYWQLEIQKNNGQSTNIVLTSDPAVHNRHEHIDHAYALSVHKAQGTTKDYAFVLLSEAMLDREWAYVSVSRARDKTHFYMSEQLSEDLGQSLHRSRQKTTALEKTHQHEFIIE